MEWTRCKWMTTGYQRTFFAPNSKKGKSEMGRGQKNGFKDVLKQDIKKSKKINWESSAMDRDPLLQTELCLFECKRSTELKEKRSRKERQQPKPNPPFGTTCPHCRRRFQANIGLISHVRVQKPNWPRQTKQDHHPRLREIATTILIISFSSHVCSYFFFDWALKTEE